jgi:hypothetical protein
LLLIFYIALHIARSVSVCVALRLAQVLELLQWAWSGSNQPEPDRVGARGPTSRRADPYDPAEAISTAEAARRAGQAERIVREWCALHKIGRKIGGDWL